MNVMSIWCEKYRPKQIEDCLLEDDLKKVFLELKEPSHMLFYGTTGVGKTSVAKILLDKFAPDDSITINFSEENGIDTIRNKIKDFISHMSFGGGLKLILCEEFDGSTSAAQEALRNMMEEYSGSTRFLFTCNAIEKISSAIISRCQSFEFKPAPLKVIWELVLKVLRTEEIKFTVEDKNSLATLVKNFYPDVRRILNELQKACLSGEFKSQKFNNDFLDSIYDDIIAKKSVFVVRERLIKNEDKFSSNYLRIYRYLFDKFLAKENKQAITLINIYINRYNDHLDKEIQFCGFLIEIEEILNGH